MLNYLIETPILSSKVAFLAWIAGASELVQMSSSGYGGGLVLAIFHKGLLIQFSSGVIERVKRYTMLPKTLSSIMKESFKWFRDIWSLVRRRGSTCCLGALRRI
jgi:hypothetical protein